MPAKRKDRTGRVLRIGESQREDGRYQYRYTDQLGKRRAVYAKTLDALRAKENTIEDERNSGLNYAAGMATVMELLERYLSLKQNKLGVSTKNTYQSLCKTISKYAFSQQRVRDIKVSDAKLFAGQLFSDGYKYGTIAVFWAILKPAFQLAYEEDVIRRNPFLFKLSDVIRNEKRPRVALTPAQQRLLMDFIKGDDVYSAYYDMLYILLGTGLRVSELCGLTVRDIDFERGRIHIDHQLLWDAHTSWLYMAAPKSMDGIRDIPMMNDVRGSLERVIANRERPAVERIIDGYSGFLFLDAKGQPMRAAQIKGILSRIMKKFTRQHPYEVMPHVTPHIFRHTFCTNMVNAGMSPKALQGIMGHSDITPTMNVYAHSNYEQAAAQMPKSLDFLSNGVVR